ncbi:MAG: WD40 repeat domain-containing protein [Ktedonobacteraceae bacterium]
MLMDEMGVKIVRPSSRRKFLVGLLGSGVALALGSVGVAQLAQTLRVAFHSKDYPFDSFRDLVSRGFSPDLNFMALIGTDSDTQLHMWDYQHQYMTTFQTGPVNSDIAWSADNAFFLNQTQLPNASETSITLDIWDMQARQKIHSRTGNNLAFTQAYWSPDGSKIGLLQDRGIAILDASQLTPLFTHAIDMSKSAIAWSPDSQKVALLVETSDSHTGSIQIWDISTQAMQLEISFNGQLTTDHGTLAWSPDGAHIAAISYQQMHILRLQGGPSNYTLDAQKICGIPTWSPDGRYLAVGIDNDIGSALEVWDVIERRKVRNFNRGTSSFPWALAWSKDGTHIIAIGSLYRQENWDWP